MLHRRMFLASLVVAVAAFATLNVRADEDKTETVTLSVTGIT